MKTVLIKQPAGMGDILFLHKVADHYATLGHPVIWPICKTYAEQGVNEYLTRFELVNIHDDFPFKEEYQRAACARVVEFDECIVVCTDGCPGPQHMQAKYQLVNLGHQDWSNYVDIKRNKIKEDSLFHDVLKIQDGERYAITTPFIGTPPEHLSFIEVDASTSLRKIPLYFYDNFNLFDWCKVLEGAEEFFIEATSPAFLLETLKPKAKRFELFSRDKKNAAIGLFKNIPWNYREDEISITKSPLSDQQYKDLIRSTA